jgi:DnaJ domain
MTHHFSIAPRLVLGVGIGASMEEIRSAFRDRSKKHHPDLGGDEWAFRMVVRAYETLKTTRGIEERHAFPSTVADRSGFETNWRNGKADRDRTVFSGNENVDPFAAGQDSMAGGSTHGAAFADQFPASKFPPTVVEFRTIDVELVWIRFELAGTLKERPCEELAATTLSVCMVISWPRTLLVKHAVEFPDAAEKNATCDRDIRGFTRPGTSSRLAVPYRGWPACRLAELPQRGPGRGRVPDSPRDPLSSRLESQLANPRRAAPH